MEYNTTNETQGHEEPSAEYEPNENVIGRKKMGYIRSAAYGALLLLSAYASGCGVFDKQKENPKVEFFPEPTHETRSFQKRHEPPAAKLEVICLKF